MIILQEHKQEKVLGVFVVPGDTFDAETSIPWYQSEIKRYTEMGYTVSSVIYPDVAHLPKEVQETYAKAYYDKALLDRLIATASDDLLFSVLKEVVKEEIKKFEIADIASALKE